MKTSERIQNNDRGFTVVELLVVAPIVILAIGAFLSLVITLTGDVIASRAENILTLNVQDALNRIETDTKLSTTFLATTGTLSVGQSGLGYDDVLETFYNSNDPAAPSPKGDMLILNMLATTGNPTDESSGLVYLANKPNSCTSSNLASNTPMSYMVVYFVKNNTLWRRTIMPANYASSSYRCAQPWQQPSCSPNIVASSSFCVTEDVKLVEGVNPENFIVDYYTRESDQITNATATSTFGANGLAERSAALEASTTLTAVIVANQVAAGHDIERAASIRATRLDVNASTIAPIVANTTPSAPSVTGTFSVPNKVVFNWTRSSGGNVSYDADYQINGGSWVSVLNDSTAVTYTVTAKHTESVTLRVRANNSAGASTYDTATVTIPLWVPLVLQNGWFNFENYYSRAAYTMTKDGVVVVKGLVWDGGTTSVGEVIADLPAGYRPSQSLIFGGMTDPNVNSRIDINANGNIKFVSGSGAWFSLETIRFVPDGRYTRSSVTPVNGWTNYGGEWAPGSYVQIADGRVFVQGLLRSGTWTDNTQIFDMPDTLLPPGYLHIAGRSDGWGYMGVDTANGLVAKGAGSTYLSVNSSFHPSSYTSWTNISLLNGWVWYGAPFSTPQYTKSPTDNMVSLKGLIRAGSGTIMNLPVGFRPKERILFTSVSGGTAARVDIEPNGNVTMMAGNNVWLSLDGISFMAEQ